MIYLQAINTKLIESVILFEEEKETTTITGPFIRNLDSTVIANIDEDTNIIKIVDSKYSLVNDKTFFRKPYIKIFLVNSNEFYIINLKTFINNNQEYINNINDLIQKQLNNDFFNPNIFINLDLI